MAWADDALKLPDVRAFAHPENIASQRVLTKTGFPEDEPPAFHTGAWSELLISRLVGHPNQESGW